MRFFYYFSLDFAVSTIFAGQGQVFAPVVPGNRIPNHGLPGPLPVSRVGRVLRHQKLIIPDVAHLPADPAHLLH